MVVMTVLGGLLIGLARMLYAPALRAPRIYGAVAAVPALHADDA